MTKAIKIIITEVTKRIVGKRRFLLETDKLISFEFVKIQRINKIPPIKSSGKKGVFIDGGNDYHRVSSTGWVKIKDSSGE